jgi:dTDP-6-deoxy-L-talose 4-dehydrogenase (NAD+)
MSSSVLLTGSSGFVGRQVLDELSCQGIRARVILRPGKNSDLEPSTADSTIYTNDIFSEDVEWWVRACKDIDTIIHVAWYAEPAKYLHSAENFNCLIGTLRMAQGAAKAGVKHFVGVGTCFEYDVSGGFLSVDTPLRPSSPYSGAKAAAFLALSQELKRQNIEFTWCRLFYLFGEGEDERRLVPYLRKNLTNGTPVELTHGSQIRDFMDVREAGRIIAKASLGNGLGAINVCSGIAITVRDLAEKIADEYGRRDLLRFGARPDNPIDPPCVVGIRNFC